MIQIAFLIGYAAFGRLFCAQTGVGCIKFLQIPSIVHQNISCLENFIALCEKTESGNNFIKFFVFGAVDSLGIIPVISQGITP